MMAPLVFAFQMAVPLQAVPPQDWRTLPPIRYVKPVQDDQALTAFVRDEVTAGRCAAGRAVPGGWILVVEVAMLVQLDGTVRRSIPRAIDCPSVEQYAAGLASSRARGNVAVNGSAHDAWYRTTLTFSWR